uniref:Uncharacterized protein n=1 Tax=uncultured bacterium contig00062 TaxID=1181545 RepID=A0A806KJZ6_9BACT|nr:hypothetical protein [uncultured bacterium contig00062]
MKEEIQNLQKECAGLNAQLNRNEEKISGLKNKLEQSENDKKNLSDTLKEEIQKRDNQLNESKALIKSTEKVLAESEKEKKLLSNEIEGLKHEIEGLREKYDCMEELEEVFLHYKSLPENIKKSMSAYICEDSRLTFAMSGARDSKIERLWDFCRLEVQKDLQYSKAISEIFSFFFIKIDSFLEKPRYELIIPSNGVMFNEGTMVISNNSPARVGVISSTLLPGYSVIDGNIVKKAIVLLKG